jgi:hypothetical protein
MYNITYYMYKIFQLKDNYTIDYDAKITSESLEKFVKTAL